MDAPHKRPVLLTGGAGRPLMGTSVTTMRRTGIALLLTPPILIVLSVGYFRLGWSRMTNECDSQVSRNALAGHTGGVAFSWRLNGGFTCRFSDGSSKQSYWF